MSAYSYCTRPLTLQPSRQLCTGYTLLSLAALTVLFYTQLPLIIQVSLMTAVSLQLILCLHSQKKRNVYQLIPEILEGRLTLINHQHQEYQVQIRPQTLITPWCIALQLTTLESGRKVSFLIFQDSLPDSAFRQLRIQLYAM